MPSVYSLETQPNLFTTYPSLLEETEVYLPTSYQAFIHLTHYSRYIPELERRETWQETVFRFLDFIAYQASINDYHINADDMLTLYLAISYLEVMPSMRLMWSAGEAVKKDAAAAYNCCYTPIDRVESFDETLYLLMNGCGVGFSVEKASVDCLPGIPELRPTIERIYVEDSKVGWAEAFNTVLHKLYSGIEPKWDLSQIRPEGARLKTFGGYASGPEPLNNLFNFTVDTFKRAQNNKLSPLQVHDIICKVGASVEAGGVRRSALLSLSDLDDTEVRGAKNNKDLVKDDKGNDIPRWCRDNMQRSQCNNSAVYSDKTQSDQFWDEWNNLIDSGSGERGIFGRGASNEKVKSIGRRAPDYTWGCNPCSEIILRPRQMCNLSEVVVRSQDSYDGLAHKVRLATMLGTIQSTITNFRYISDDWRRNCEEERLLGVSLTGIADNQALFSDNGNSSALLYSMKQEAIETNADWARRFNIPQSAAITAVKPSGTVSQLVDSASGLHARYSPYYIRRVRLNKSDPVAKYMVDAGVPYEMALDKPENTWVFSFPMQAPPDSVFTKNLGTLKHAKIWKNYQDNWCEHKPSATINIHNGEWNEIGQWIHENLASVSGVSFLPYSDHGYDQAPYEEVSEGDFHVLNARMPKIDWYSLRESEAPEQSGPAACEGGVCSLGE